MGRKHIDHTITSKEGCKIHIVGDVDYSLFPPSVNGFTGTITISGSGKCPNAKLTFGVANPNGNGNNSGDKNSDILLDLDSNNIYQLSEINWKKNNDDVPKQIDKKIINSVLIEELKKLENDMISDFNEMKVKTKKRDHLKDISVNVNVNY